MSTCPNCGRTYESTVRICPNDGTVLAAPPAKDAHIGETLDGKYRLDAPLGQGGMGTIYRATHLMLDKQVAVKLIKPELVTSPDVVRRFQREARAAGNLNHPNIAAVYDLGQAPDGTLYIALELISGPSLKDVIRASGPMAVDRIIRIVRQIASALALAHRHGIVHRDLKPQNVMLATGAGAETPKLLDFGIAKTFDDAATQLTQTGFVLGTPQYMSPEQAAGRPIDGRSDLYSLGIMLYEMLIGEVPFSDPSTPAVLVKHLTEAPSPPSLRRPDLTISPVLESIALRCLAKEPGDRYQSADELIAALPETGTAVASTAASHAPTVLAGGVSAAAMAETVATPPQAAYAPTVMTPPGAAAAAPPPAPAAPALAVAEPRAVSLTVPAAPAPLQKIAPAVAIDVRPKRDRSFVNLVILAALLLLILGGAAYATLRLIGGLSRSTGEPQEVAGAALPLAAMASGDGGQIPPADVDAEPTTPAPPPGGGDGGEVPAAGGPAAAAASAAAFEARTAGPGAETPAAPVATATGAGAAAVGSTVSASPSSAVATAPPAAPAVAPPAPPVVAQVTNPAVLFRCDGAPQVCAALRSAMPDALGRYTLRPVRNADAADVIVDVTVTVVDERAEVLYGQEMLTRTYSVEFASDTRDGDVVPMPPASTFSFDSSVGQRRLDDESQRLSRLAAERVRAYWRTRTGG